MPINSIMYIYMLNYRKNKRRNKNKLQQTVTMAGITAWKRRNGVSQPHKSHDESSASILIYLPKSFRFALGTYGISPSCGASIMVFNASIIS